MAFHPQLVVLVGIPGCGKSTWAERMLLKSFGGIASSDAIREELSHVSDQSRNDEVFKIFHDRIAALLMCGFDAIADSTALTRSSREQLCSIGSLHGAYIDLVYFSNCDEAMRRNQARERVVPGDVMIRMLDKYEQFRTELVQERGWYRSITEIRSVT